ncbi:MAG: NAD-dependent protein deacylase [Bacillota bacterium]|nr:NAD-dependent protein deacylase [Bacillota bacterium]
MKNQLWQWISESENIVFFTGAGVSTESGIPDFRGSAGLYRDASAEEILSRRYFFAHPDVFYRFYLDHLVYPDAEPNILHRLISDLEKEGKTITVVTQNIDGLHQKAGNRRVLCLHGSIETSTCLNCGDAFTLAEVLDKTKKAIPPRCACGGLIKPDVVLFGEGLDYQVLSAAAKAIYDAQMLIVCGTSLVVNPAASLVQYYRGKRFVIVNRDRTPYDPYADLVIRDGIGQVCFEIAERMKRGG